MQRIGRGSSNRIFTGGLFAGGLFAGVLAAGMWASGAVAWAAPAGGSKDKIPAASKALREAFKLLKKQENFEVQLQVAGGISDNEQHKITELAVRETYLGSVYGNKVMHLPKLKSFRTPKSGARFVQGMWRRITADKKGVVMDRLFKFPLEALGDAAKHAKTAQWREPEEEDEESDSESRSRKRRGAKRDGDRDEKGDGGGRTVVGGADDDEDSAPRPTKIIVEAPPKEALAHFLKVENSGCLSGG